MASKTSASGNRLIANNKKAYFDYFTEEKYEAGMYFTALRLNQSEQVSAQLRNLTLRLRMVKCMY